MARKKNIEPIPPPIRLEPRITPPLMGVRLPPFSGDRSSCVKCGGTTAKTVYLNSGQNCTHCHNGGFKSVWGTERLHRICDRCAFSWDEACVPAIPQQVKDTLLMPVVPSEKPARRYG